MNELNDLFTSSLNQTNLINKKLAIAQVAGMIYAQGKDLEEAVSAARQIVEKVYA